MTGVQSKSSLSPGRKRLLEIMQGLNFGRLESVTLRAGEPCFDPLPSVVREIKFGADNGPRHELRFDDFLLKKQVLEFLAYLDHLGDGTIDLIEIKHGLPFRMILAEKSA